MAKRYTLVTEFELTEFSRKDGAVRAAEKLGTDVFWQVKSPAGAVLLENTPAEAPAEEPVVEPEEAEEDLIGDVEDEAPAPAEQPAEEPETAEEAPTEEGTADADAELADETPVGSKTVDIEKMKDRIAMFLAKAEATNFEEERDTFNAAAEKLMIRLGIARAELEGRGEAKPEKIVEVRREYPGNYSISYIPFVYHVAGGFGHLTVLQQRTAGLTRYAYIIGAESDVQEFCTLLDSLEIQVKHALRLWQKENIEVRRGLTDMQKFLQHRSFIEGFGAKVGSRLAERRDKEETKISTGTELVLVSKDERRQEFIDNAYGELKQDKAQRRHSSVGFAAGHRAGANASLGEKGIAGTKGTIEA
jgi:hypothetical protein